MAPSSTTPAEHAARELLARRENFLAFVRKRVPTGVDDDEVFQQALTRAVLRIDSLRDRARLVPWFYRILRREIARTLASMSSQPPREGDHVLDEIPAAPVEPENVSSGECQCAEPLLRKLQPSYAEILRRVDVDEQPLREAAAELNITPGHAAVRAHRARRAMKRAIVEYCGTDSLRACLDCTCELGARCGSMP